jgi:hypothetical protein
MKTTLRIHIAADWSVEEFAQLYTSANALYLFFAIDSGEARSLAEVVGSYERHLVETLERLDRRGGLEFALGEIAGRISTVRSQRDFLPSGALLDLFRGSMRDIEKRRFFDEPSMLAEVLSASINYPEWVDQKRIRILGSGRWRAGLRVPHAQQLLLAEKVRPARDLLVQRTQHNSPGFTDLTGVGQIVGHLKEFLLKLLDCYVTTDERRLKNVRLRHENDLLALEVLEKRLDIMERAGSNQRALQQVAAEVAPHVNFFSEAASRGLITHVDDGLNDG